ncbi:MAG: hypothetical protein WDZ81_00810 [Candidatus Saccharimonadales bacterium]
MTLLAELLDAEEPLFSLAIKELEDHTHKRGTDTALIGEIIEKANQRAKILGLDPDFTGRELYAALMKRVEHDNLRIAKRLGGKDPNDLHKMIPLIKNLVEELDIPKDAWVLKEDIAKEMLKMMPPKNIMKKLGRQNIQSLLKNEDLYEVYGALRFAEDGDWLNEFIKIYERLTPADFEARQIKMVVYDEKKWGNVAEKFIEKKLHNITHLKEMGAIMIMPVDLNKSKMTGKGITLKVLPLLLHYFNEIRLYSAFFKLIQNKENFGELVVDTLIADTPNVDLLRNHRVGWRVIQRYYGKLKDESHPEMFEPHVHPEDLHWRKAEETIYKFDPKMEYWRNMDYVGVKREDGIVTFNLMDVALGYANGNDFANRYIYHFRESLWNEIFMRYLGQANLEQRILMRLDNEIINPNKIPVKNRR